MNLTETCQQLVLKLKTEGMILATAESCTGGWIAKLITDISGSSQVYAGSVVSYSNAMKQAWLQVKSETLTQYGAVSEPVVLQMLTGICQQTGCQAAIAVSGVAGPSGGTPEKPVGTVFIGWQIGRQQIIQKFRFDGNRNAVRQQTAETALVFLLNKLTGLTVTHN